MTTKRHGRKRPWSGARRPASRMRSRSAPLGAGSTSAPDDWRFNKRCSAVDEATGRSRVWSIPQLWGPSLQLQVTITCIFADSVLRYEGVGEVGVDRSSGLHVHVLDHQLLGRLPFLGRLPAERLAGSTRRVDVVAVALELGAEDRLGPGDQRTRLDHRLDRGIRILQRLLPALAGGGDEAADEVRLGLDRLGAGDDAVARQHDADVGVIEMADFGHAGAREI